MNPLPFVILVAPDLNVIVRVNNAESLSESRAGFSTRGYDGLFNLYVFVLHWQKVRLYGYV